MIFKELIIKDGILVKKVSFNNQTNLIFSKKNSVGKTTFLRALLYACGYNVPNTKRLNFRRLEFYLIIENNNIEYKLYRRDSYFTLDYGLEEKVYSLPGDFYEIQSIITGIAGKSILDNLLGAFYVDQEKGWTLLNRGKVIGDIRFSIDELVRGLSDRSCEGIKVELRKIEHELQKCNYIASVAEYQKQLNETAGNITYDSADDSVRKDIAKYKLDRYSYNKELEQINRVIKKNEELVDYITGMKLIVETESGECILVTKANLMSYKDTQSMLITRRNILAYHIKEINDTINSLEASMEKEMTLVDSESIIDRFDKKISDIKIDQEAIYNKIKQLKEKKEYLKDKLDELTKQNNEIVVKMYDYIVEYCNEFSIPMSYLSSSRNFIFTNNLTVFSGAIFHKMVFAFKLTYIRIIREKTGLVLPIVLDSPSGREVEVEAVKEMLNVLQRDFSMHQIIIASIYNYNLTNKFIIEFKEKMFE